MLNLFKSVKSAALINKTRAVATTAISAALLATTSAAPSAHAEQVDTVKYSQSGAWTTYADSAGGCFSLTQYSAGTVIKIGFYERAGNLQPYMIVGGPRVSNAVEYEKYRTRAIFDNWNAYQGVSTGGRTPAGRAFLVMELTPEFVTAFAKHNQMAIEVAGESVTSLPLADTYAAMVQTLSCQTDFATQSTRKPSQNTSSSRPTTGEPRLSQF